METLERTITSPGTGTLLSQVAEDHGLKANSLSVKDIVFFIVAAASPLTCVILTTAIMIGTGNGVGSPAAFALVTTILLIFAVGYLAMTPYVKTAGSLYAYVTLGLGRYAGLGCAALMIFAYTAVQAGCYGGFGHYASELIAKSFGVDVPWWTLAIASSLFGLFLSIRGVHSGAVVLGVLLSTECLLLFALCLGMIFSSPMPLSDFSLEPFSTHALFARGIGVSLVFACAGFIGFEGSAIYREEAKDADRTIPRATYFSVAFMGTIFSITTWLVINVLGMEKSVAIAQREGGDLIFYVSDRFLGPFATHFFNIFIVTALFAATVTFHNNIARYFYTLGRQHLLWKPLGYTRVVEKTPYVACIVQAASAIAIIAIFAVFRLDPYTILFATLTGWGTVGLIFAQTVAAFAVLVFFRRNRVSHNPMKTMVAPAIACLGFLFVLYYAFASAELLMGLKFELALPLAMTVFAVFAGGSLFALWVRSCDPDKFERIKTSLIDQEH